MELSSSSVSSTPVDGYLDTFNEDGPVLFDGINRTSAVEDVRNILIYISFITFFVAFLIIFPGIRRERLSTFICVTVSLILGAVILVSNFGTNWHVASANISSPYRAFSKEKIFANIGVFVGLQSVNITLQALPFHQRSEEINYNERFYWIDPTEMKIEHKKALAKGLPFPILTVAEYLSQDGEGFCWGRRYRLAGYYSSVLLWASFITWILMNVLLCAVPKYGVYLMELTGILMLSTNAIYTILLPKKSLIIPFEKEKLTFEYGWCFWFVLAGGLLAVIVGSILTIIHSIFPNKFSTILEIDYDTPYRYFVNASSNDSSSTSASTSSSNNHVNATVTCSSATQSTTCCPRSSTSGTAHAIRQCHCTMKCNSLCESLVDNNNDQEDDNLTDENCSYLSCNQLNQPHHNHHHHHCHCHCSHSCHMLHAPYSPLECAKDAKTNLTSLHKFKSDSVIAVSDNKLSTVDKDISKTPVCKSVTTTATIEYNSSRCADANCCCFHPDSDERHRAQCAHSPDHHLQHDSSAGQRRASSSSSSTYTKSQLRKFVQANGVMNDAFVNDENEMPANSVDQFVAEVSTSNASIALPSDKAKASMQATHHTQDDDQDVDDGHASDSSEISTTMIDGKRAISLHNFGRFAARQSKVATTPSLPGNQYTQHNRFSHVSEAGVSRSNARQHSTQSLSTGDAHRATLTSLDNSSHQSKSSHPQHHNHRR